MRPRIEGDILQHAPRPVNPLRGSYASISAGGVKIYLPRKAREIAGIDLRVMLAYNPHEDLLNFYPPLPRSKPEKSFSIRTGYVTTVVLARVLGYVPATVFVPIDIMEGRVAMSLRPLRGEILQLSIA